MNHKQSGFPWLAIILILAVMIRLGIVIAVPSVFAFDKTGEIHGSEAYDTYARNILSTGHFGRFTGVSDAAIPPLYSYTLAILYRLFGRGHFQVVFLHILLDVLSMIMLVEIGKRLLPFYKTAGLLTALFYAVYPYLVFQNMTLIDTPLFIFWLHAFVLVMILLRERPKLDRGTWGLSILGGIILGLSMLTRPIMPPLAVLVGIWFLFRLNLVQTIARLLPVTIVSILIVSVWIVRNYSVFNAFVPMTTTAGGNFWQGNSKYTVPYFKAGYDVQWASPSELKPTGYASREDDAQVFQLGLQYLGGNPDKIPELLWTKFLVYWSIDITPRRNPVNGVLPPIDYNGAIIIEENIQNGTELTGLPKGDPVAAYSQPLFDQVGRIVHRIYFGTLFLLALIGIAVTFRQWREVSLLWFVQISMTIIYLVFHPSTRYRVPTDPTLFLFSASALIWLWYRLKTTQVVQSLSPSSST